MRKQTKFPKAPSKSKYRLVIKRPIGFFLSKSEGQDFCPKLSFSSLSLLQNRTLSYRQELVDIER